MNDFKRVLAWSALSLGFAIAGLPVRAEAQQAGAATASQDSAAQDSVKKAEAAECVKVNQAMRALLMKKIQEQRSQPKDSTVLGPGDLPAGVTRQSLRRCLQGGGSQPRRRAMPPKPTAPSGGGKADCTKGKAP